MKDQAITIDDLAEREYEAQLTGTDTQLSLSVGSEHEVRRSTLKVKMPGLLTVEGQFQEGDKVTVTFTCEVEQVTFKRISDPKIGFVIGLERQHLALVDPDSVQNA